MFGGFCGSWRGVASDRRDAPWNGMKRPSGNGRKSAGRKLKKGPRGGSNPSVRGRERADRTTESVSYVVAPRTDVGAAITLQLEESVGHRWSHVVALLLSTVSGSHQESPDHRIPEALDAAYSRAAAGGMGPPAQPPEPVGSGICCRHRGRVGPGTVAGLCPGTQSCGTSAGESISFQSPYRPLLSFYRFTGNLRRRHGQSRP